MSRSIPYSADEFLYEHESVIRVALQKYRDDMGQVGADLQASYDAIKDDPEKVAAQDATMFTTNGLRYSAQAMFEAVERARAALEDLEKVTD